MHTSVNCSPVVESHAGPVSCTIGPIISRLDGIKGDLNKALVSSGLVLRTLVVFIDCV